MKIKLSESWRKLPILTRKLSNEKRCVNVEFEGGGRRKNPKNIGAKNHDQEWIETRKEQDMNLQHKRNNLESCHLYVGYPPSILWNFLLFSVCVRLYGFPSFLCVAYKVLYDFLFVYVLFFVFRLLYSFFLVQSIICCSYFCLTKFNCKQLVNITIDSIDRSVKDKQHSFPSLKGIHITIHLHNINKGIYLISKINIWGKVWPRLDFCIHFGWIKNTKN